MGRIKDWTDRNVDTPSWVRKVEKDRLRREAREEQRKQAIKDREKRGVHP